MTTYAQNLTEILDREALPAGGIISGDVDYAAETAKYTQARILSQAGLSVLSQANSQPEAVLQLLRGS